MNEEGYKNKTWNELIGFNFKEAIEGITNRVMDLAYSVKSCWKCGRKTKVIGLGIGEFVHLYGETDDPRNECVTYEELYGKAFRRSVLCPQKRKILPSFVGSKPKVPVMRELSSTQRNRIFLIVPMIPL